MRAPTPDGASCYQQLSARKYRDTKCNIRVLPMILGAQSISKLACSLGAPVVTPPWGSKHVPELRRDPRGPTDVARDRGDLMEADAQRVERVDVLGQPIDDALAFRLERSEQSIPDDEDARVVAI